MTSIKRQWNNFCSMLNELNISTLNEQKFYKAISGWLVVNRKAFDRGVWDRYGLGELSRLNPSLYKVECMESTLTESIELLNRIQPYSRDSMAMTISDTLWDMVAFKTNIQCSNCQDDDFRALLDPESNEIILSCDLCCWSQSISGNKWSHSQKLIPANKNQLKDSNVE